MKPSHIFVLGTGRSGTCWMGRILGEHQKIDSFVEPKILFDKATYVAVYSDQKSELLSDIYEQIDSIAEQTELVAGYKVHTMLWFAEKLAKRYPEAKFIGMQRTPYACVASMLIHPGVRGWCEKWDKYPIPNPFLGVTEGNKKEYRGYTLTQRCALRWITHYNEMLRVKEELQERLLVIDYERLVVKPNSNMKRIQQFLGLEEVFPAIQTKPSSLQKWEKHLSPAQIEQISILLRRNKIDHFAI